MSKATISLAIQRIEIAAPESPLAVFRINSQHVNVTFANTVESRARINRRDPSLIGVYDKHSDPAHVRKSLTNATRGQAK
jgi:hypothetical protein